MAIDLADVARRLREVIVALDRRVARPDDAAEPTILEMRRLFERKR